MFNSYLLIDWTPIAWKPLEAISNRGHNSDKDSGEEHGLEWQMGLISATR